MMKIVIHKRISAGAGRVEIHEAWHRDGEAVNRLFEDIRVRVAAGRPVTWKDVDRDGRTVEHQIPGAEIEFVQLFGQYGEIASTDR